MNLWAVLLGTSVDIFFEKPVNFLFLFVISTSNFLFYFLCLLKKDVENMLHYLANY